MALIFTALEPTYEITGNAPEYRARFTDESTGAAADPDSVDAVEVYDSAGNLLRTYTPPDIENPSTGTYEVTDEVVDESDDLVVRWTYTEDGAEQVVEHTFEVVPEDLGTPEKELRDYVWRMLGQGVVHVELPAGTLDTCIEHTKTWYAHRAGQMKRASIQLVAGQQEYDVAPDADTVAHVTLKTSSGDLSGFGGWGTFGRDQVGMDLVPAGTIYAGSGAGFNSMATQIEQHFDTWREIVGANLHWEWEPGEKKLWVMPAPKKSRKAFVDYVSDTVDLAAASATDEYLVREYALAQAKEALGRIRSKFDSFQTPGGSTSLDGKDLLQEAKKKKKELDEEATAFSGGGWMIVG